MSTETVEKRQVHEFLCDHCGENTATLDPNLTLCDECYRDSSECERCGERHNSNSMHGDMCDDCHNHMRVSWAEAYEEARWRRPVAPWGAK